MQYFDNIYLFSRKNNCKIVYFSYRDTRNALKNLFDIGLCELFEFMIGWDSI